MAPGTLAYTWLGYAGREALVDNRSAINYGLIALALLAAVALLPWLIRRLRGDRELQWIEVELLASWLKDGANVILIDVRGPDEFTGPLGHLPQALNLPVGTLPDRLPEIKMFKDQPIVLVCRTDKRSARPQLFFARQAFRMSACSAAAWNSGTDAGNDEPCGIP